MTFLKFETIFYVLILLLISYYTKLVVSNETSSSSALRKWFQFNHFGFEFYDQLNNKPLIGSEECSVQLQELLKGLDRQDIWALKLIDAWGKFPAGVLQGHLMEMGNFEECIHLKQHLAGDYYLKGKYCLTKIPFDKLKLQIGICVPSKCLASEMDILLRQYLETKLNLNMDAATILLRESNCSVELVDSFEAIDWVAIAIIAVLLILTILSTSYDYFASKWCRSLQPLLNSFSIRSNMRELFHITSSTNSPFVIPCLHGIRCVTTIWIIFGHSNVRALNSPSINAIVISQWYQMPYAMLQQSFYMAVDTFFYLSALLLVLSAMREMERNSGRLNIPMLYLHRYLRLTPIIAITMLLVVSLYRYMGNGPLWHNLTDRYQLCHETWWATLLYVQNYAAVGKMCMGHTWYLAVDMQLYILSPLALMAIWKWQRKALAALLVIGLILFAYLFAIINVEQLLVADGKGNMGSAHDEMRKIYFPTHTRTSPWIIGLIFGYFLYNHKGKRMVLSKFLAALGWLLCLSLLLACIFGLYSNTQTAAVKPLAPLEGAFYLSLCRIAWPLGLCWLVFACIYGYAGPIDRFLSWPGWQPISKLCYCMYIWHFLIVIMNGGRLKTNTYFSIYDMILGFWSNFGITMMVSTVMYLCVEAPMGGIEKFLFSKKKVQVKSDHTMS